MLPAEKSNEPKPYPPAPWRVCPRCRGVLIIWLADTDHDHAPPLDLWEIICRECAHTLADWHRGMLTWRILGFQPPTTPAEGSAPPDVKWLRDWRDLYSKHKDAA